ncbi:hypothetical protein [Plantactinospora endophytica]|uniref:ABC transporter permease n=1 Tax=Plantactinospora endophytica TaxID=673535 RepID=A0ABQ4EB02_9ACTN|nr:hypothetical protein [Plantactinospora endophytica]GIG91905.1 hypothetical protein Pen02_68410 [Plantactinospora endophytica]
MTAPGATAVRAPVAIAVADFRERVRRPAYAVVLAAAVGLGYLAVPEVDGRWVIVNAGTYRGVYDSAYVGTVTALAGALWLTIAGFYVVRGAIVRDARGGVGQLLAATPLSGRGYLAGKFLSNLLVLTSMLGVLAGTAVLMQLARGEDRAVDPIALLLPFGLLALPVLAVTAALAVLFETVRPLRGGFGNVVWFFAAMVGAVVGQGPDAPLGGLGVAEVARSLRAGLADAGLRPAGEFGLGLMYLDDPLRTFEWSGLDPDAGFVAQRLLLFLVAAGIAVLPALWFGRFDPSRTARRRRPARPVPTPPVPAPYPNAAVPAPYPNTAVPAPYPNAAVPAVPYPNAPVPTVPYPGVSWPPIGDGLRPAGLVSDTGPDLSLAGPDLSAPAGMRLLGAAPSWLRSAGPPTADAASGVAPVRPAGRGASAGFGRLFAGELRVLCRSASRWWWLGAGLLALVGAVAPIEAVPAVALPLAWIWPVLLWSRLGSRSHEYGLTGLLGAYPGLRRRMLAEWLAGVALAGLTGLVPMLRMLIDLDVPGLAAGVAGALFVPSLALAAGVSSRTHRLFQVGYLALWYSALNGIAALDTMGAVRLDGRPAGPGPLLVCGCALALLGIALLFGTLRHARR